MLAIELDQRLTEKIALEHACQRLVTEFDP